MPDTSVRLEDFVAETLKSIIAGVSEAKQSASDHGAIVNPGTNSSHGISGAWHRTTGTLIQSVEFDVAVTTTAGTKTKGGIGVFVGPIGVGSSGASDLRRSPTYWR